jgi:hypothetical protein
MYGFHRELFQKSIDNWSVDKDFKSKMLNFFLAHRNEFGKMDTYFSNNTVTLSERDRSEEIDDWYSGGNKLIGGRYIYMQPNVSWESAIDQRLFTNFYNNTKNLLNKYKTQSDPQSMLVCYMIYKLAQADKNTHVHRTGVMVGGSKKRKYTRLYDDDKGMYQMNIYNKMMSNMTGFHIDKPLNVYGDNNMMRGGGNIDTEAIATMNSPVKIVGGLTLDTEFKKLETLLERIDKYHVSKKSTDKLIHIDTFDIKNKISLLKENYELLKEKMNSLHANLYKDMAVNLVDAREKDVTKRYYVSQEGRLGVEEYADDKQTVLSNQIKVGGTELNVSQLYSRINNIGPMLHSIGGLLEDLRFFPESQNYKRINGYVYVNKLPDYSKNVGQFFNDPVAFKQGDQTQVDQSQVYQPQADQSQVNQPQADQLQVYQPQPSSSYQTQNPSTPPPSQQTYQPQSSMREDKYDSDTSNWNSDTGSDNYTSDTFEQSSQQPMTSYISSRTNETSTR